MGIDIYIGNKIEDEDGYLVQRTENQDAPSWESDVSEKTNLRSPSFTDFPKFCNETGLKDLFNELMVSDSCVTDLTADHLAEFTAARIKWQRKSKLAAGFLDGQDSILAKLIWYEWWVRWALENCTNPAIEFR